MRKDDHFERNGDGQSPVNLGEGLHVRQIWVYVPQLEDDIWAVTGLLYNISEMERVANTSSVWDPFTI